MTNNCTLRKSNSSTRAQPHRILNVLQPLFGQPFDEALGEFVGELIHHSFGQRLTVTRWPDGCPGSCCRLPRRELGYDLSWDATALHRHTSEVQRNVAEAPCSWRDPSARPLPAISPTSPKSANAVGVRATRPALWRAIPAQVRADDRGEFDCLARPHHEHRPCPLKLVFVSCFR